MDPMVDNSWIHEKRPSGRSGWQSKMMKTKVFMTVAVILAGTILAVSLNGLGSNATLYQSEGVVVDFGGYKTSWTDVDYKETDDPVELLVKASEKHGYTYTMGEDGKLESVYDGSATYSNDPTHSWGLWYVEKKSTSFTRSEGYGIKASDYTVTVWAYTENAEPAVAVDATGTSIYGYSQPSSMVTLSPVCTEIVASMNAVSLIVGTDSYSNYPSSVVAGRDNGSIAVVGTYTDPSYESIMHRGPDMVICDGSQYNQVQVAKTLRNSEVNSVVLYNAEDEKSIIDNIFITGVAMNYGMRHRKHDLCDERHKVRGLGRGRYLGYGDAQYRRIAHCRRVVHVRERYAVLPEREQCGIGDERMGAPHVGIRDQIQPVVHSDPGFRHILLR